MKREEEDGGKGGDCVIQHVCGLHFHAIPHFSMNTMKSNSGAQTVIN